MSSAVDFSFLTVMVTFAEMLWFPDGVPRLARSLGAFAAGTDDVVVLHEEALADQAGVARVAGETAAVPVTAFERHVARALSAET